MRPHAHFGLSAFFSAKNDDRLPLDGDVVYNNQQFLPFFDEVLFENGRVYSSLEAAMESPWPDSHRSVKSSKEKGCEPSSVETRAQRLERIRREIDAGTYETPEKLEIALGRMMGVLVD